MRKKIKNIRSGWIIGLSAIFLLVAFNFCFLASLAAARTHEEAKTKMAHECAGQENNRPGESPANHPGTDKEPLNSLLPCCEGHMIRASQLPSEKFFPQFLFLAASFPAAPEPESINHASHILSVDRPPPEQDLIAAIFKKE